MNLDLPDDAEIKVDVGWSQQIQKITASARQEKGPRVMNSSRLLTRWIDTEGARRIMVEAGIPIAEFSVADRDRQDYVFGLLFEAM